VPAAVTPVASGVATPVAPPAEKVPEETVDKKAGEAKPAAKKVAKASKAPVAKASPEKPDAEKVPGEKVQAAKVPAEKAEKKSAKAAKKAPPLPPFVLPKEGVCPPTHPVKAKLASLLFHIPGGLTYDRVRPDRCYVDVPTAVGDGFSSAKR
jgi:hypothetical protein